MLEDMLRACAISFPEKWDECLNLAEFSYNNSYQESIHMAPLKLCMETNVEHHLIGLKCETMDILGLISSKKLESKLVLFRVI